MYRPGTSLTWRKLLVLLNHLPAEAATITAIRNATPEEALEGAAGDPNSAPWSSLELMIALMIDELRDFAWMYAQSHSQQRITRPEPIERPGVRRARRRVITLREARTIDPRLKGLSDEDAAAKFRSLTNGR